MTRQLNHIAHNQQQLNHIAHNQQVYKPLEDGQSFRKKEKMIRKRN
jgi:hypothetical protein